MSDSTTPSLYYGMNYSPTWPGWSAGAAAQFNDSDFFNDSFEDLWHNGTDSAGNHRRDDVGSIASFGFNFLRIYNWGPSRGYVAASGSGPSATPMQCTGHLKALDYAESKSMKVMVPVSNYFLSDNIYAWNGQAPGADYDFSKAPSSIQDDFNYFIASVTKSDGTIHPAVHSFSVGNEVDINTFAGQGNPPAPATDPAVRLWRINWWIYNLYLKLGSDGILFTSPFSDADQGGTITSPPSYWFGAVVSGVTTSTPLPNGTAGGSGNFSLAVPGLSSLTGVMDAYFNSVNIYTYTTKLSSTIGQYDAWTTQPSNTDNWPGQQFTCSLMLTETGYNRASNSATEQDTQYSNDVSGVASTIKTYVAGNSSTKLIGYCIFEWNDEPAENQSHWGVKMNNNAANPSGKTLYTATAAATEVSYGPVPSASYPVVELYDVTNASGDTLLSGLQGEF